MSKQVLVVGLGQFGLSLVRSLEDTGVEVLAVDLRGELVAMAAEFATEAIRADTTDESALLRLAPGSRDVCVCAIGTESREASIITTALMSQMGASRILARATDQLHERILRMVGAHEIINPEIEYGRRLATSIAYEGVLGEYSLNEGVSITELKIPPAFVGKNLLELALPRRFGITVVAVQREGKTLASVNPNEPLTADDLLIVVGQSGRAAKLMDQVGH
ncbi:MAG: TrkA family potassium uptake protein [bacterium]|nr:TrkA family potassium uptake protein [bacterium]